ncbi:hypothetical protein GC101_05925 [Paenibacillus sp. LMG 31459]|uniref:Lipoprotein n=1 Tax=Paenibacillus phytohabitans TaxID=2654978 RepID=A0ABX1YBT6_9BACL|nr:hypothetical protein [Paenibacillus phytohabitans]NOU78415.1 hypothetical protein [Paenibacillus phytohabitans]
MKTNLVKITMAFALLCLPVAITGCGGSPAEVTQSATATATTTPTPPLANYSVEDKTLEYLESFGTSSWNTEASKDIAEKIRVKARESEEDKYTYLEIADSIEKDDIQNVKKLFTKIGGVIPASVTSRYPDPTPTPVPTVEPAEGGEIVTYSDLDQEFGARALNLAKNFLEKDLSQEIRDEAQEVILKSLEFLTKENQSKFKEMAIAIQKDDKATVEKLYTELLPLYQGIPASAAAASAAPEPVAAPDDIIHLKGKSDQATDFFNLMSGIAIVEATDAGDSNFVIYLYDETGNSKEMLVNEIGPYKGKSLVVIPEDGKYMLNVESDGSWKADITQSIPDNIKSAPVKLTGKGNDVVFARLQSKLTRFTSKHVGESNFVVKVNDSLLLVNEVGNYSGSTAESIESDGIYVFAVEADGQWSINIE